MASGVIHCFCGQQNDKLFMIQCDACKVWVHGSCVGVREHESLEIEKFHCPPCATCFGPSIRKERTNWHRHDHTDPDASGKAVQTGTHVFVQELKSRHFPSADQVIQRLRGQQLTRPYLLQNGFSQPILVDSKEGLGLMVPPDTFTVQDVMEYIGEDYVLDAIDVYRQDDIKMTMKEWVEYYSSPNRTKVYNVISLEVSKTRLSQMVKPPSIVQKMSWVENHWPENLSTTVATRPDVMKYCLMGTEGSFTDFHIDFGGTSVWYHVIKGEKIFYLIQPSTANLSLYQHWMSSSNQSETFFGDQVDACYKLVLGKGQTLFIPTGWIHAVLTPIDSLVFGGNFLHSLNIGLQLQVYELEQRIKVPPKYQFPWFETTHWLAAPHVMEQLKDFLDGERRPPQVLVTGVKALALALKTWSAEKEQGKGSHEEIPPGISAQKLVKGLFKEVRLAEKHLNGKTKVEREKRIKPSPASKRKANNLQRLDVQSKANSSMPGTDVSSVSNQVVKTESDVQLNNLQSSSLLTSSLQPGLCTSSLEMPMSNDESNQMNTDSNFVNRPVKVENASLLLKGDDLEKNISNPLRLKFSHGKVIRGQEENLQSAKDDSIYNFVDSDEDNLVVDEHPRSNRKRTIPPLRQKQALHPKTMDTKSSQLKFKLAKENVNAEENPSVPKNGTIDDLLLASNFALDSEGSRISLEDELSGGRTSPSTREAIQGMLFMSKSAFHFTDPASTNLVCPVTPSNDDCMKPPEDSSLSCLKPLGPSLLSPQSASMAKSLSSLRTTSSALQSSRQKRYMMEEDDFEETLKQCHEDGEFIYLGLEASDDELHVFKPRGRAKRDEAWNPKAKCVPNCPKPERPVREGVRKEAVESGLAAAAARLATMPPPKRPYHRKKPLPPKPKEVVCEPQPGPSTSSDTSQGLKRPSGTMENLMKSNKKPKKGFATAKQRLGKILKIHKMLY